MKCKKTSALKLTDNDRKVLEKYSLHVRILPNVGVEM